MRFPMHIRTHTRAWLFALVTLPVALGADAHAAGSEGPASTAGANPALENAPSPYLRHHARDAVRWRTWGQAAFAEARRRNVPVFLSVGYLACYWCGVMQRESFSDGEVAAILNAHFVPVLVDREARPAVDALHLSVSRMLNGVAGWPNNVFLTPEAEPFRAAGYLPKKRFIALLQEVRAAWRREPERLRREARDIAAKMRERWQKRARTKLALSTLDVERLRTIAQGVAARFDPFFGGLDATPKHPRAPLSLWLARVALAHDERAARDALLKTLRGIVRGGVHDHLEGGFFRYATDAAWHIPHFEKMLPDQALMADALREGWRLSGDPELERAARSALDFALSELRVEGGAFAAGSSATAPDGEEGGRYLFTPEQLRRLLPAADAEWALKTFGQISDGDLAGKVVVQVQDVDFSDPEEMARLQRVLKILRKAAAQRPPHPRDEKVIGGWNGLMIAALARAALAWSEERYAKEAALAARFALKNLRRVDGLARHWLAGAAHGRATLADYAHLIAGLLALHDAQPDGGWLKPAEELAREAVAGLRDGDSGQWWLSAEREGAPRLRPPGDGALPAADAQMALNLLRLAARTGEEKWRSLAEETLSVLLPGALEAPETHATALRAADIALRGDDSLVRHAAKGKVRIRAMWTNAASGAFTIRLGVARGWHVQAHRPDDKNLIPTDVRLLRPKQARIEALRWPRPVMQRLGFARQPLKLLDGRFDITGRIRVSEDVRAPVVLELQMQACSNEICLPPDWVRLYLPARER